MSYYKHTMAIETLQALTRITEHQKGEAFRIRSAQALSSGQAPDTADHRAESRTRVTTAQALNLLNTGHN